MENSDPKHVVSVNGLFAEVYDAKPEENFWGNHKIYIYDGLSDLSDVERDKIIIDPGFGFGKTLDHNYTLLNNLDKFSALSHNILIGISRKSMIGNLLDKSVDERLDGSLAASVISLVNKASIIRTHDVLETKIVSNAIRRIIDAA